MKSFLLFFFTFFVLLNFNNSFSQVTTQWRSVYNGSDNDTDIVSSMIVDTQGNVYVTGSSNSPQTGKDIATIKYNSVGQQIWVSRYNNIAENKDDVGSAIAVDAGGNVYVTGYSSGAGTFKNYITLKYSTIGELLWASEYNGKGNDDDVSTAIATDGLGNVFVTGFSVGLISSEDFLTIKYNSDGVAEWISSYDNPLMDDVDIANALALDGTGNVYVTGYSIGKGSSEDFATVKYNSAGEEQWVQRYNGTGNGYDITSALTTDISGNVYVTGFSLGDGSSEDFATLKYDPQGNNLWVKRYNGQSNQYDISTSLAADNQGNVYVTGYSFDSQTSEDYTTIKYSPEGNEEWISKFDGAAGKYDIAAAVKVDNNGGVYVTGYSYGFDSMEDYATIKYNESGSQQWIEIFDNNTHGSDIASALALDANGNVLVTGFSYESAADGIDYVTLKYNQTVGINQLNSSVPGDFTLKQNYPNPFNPSTQINYELRITGYVSLKVYDVRGNELTTLVNERQSPGNHEINFNAANLPSGTYFYKLQSGDFSETKKMLLLK